MPLDWQGKLQMLGIGIVAFALVVGLILVLADIAPKTGKEKWQLVIFFGPGALLLFIGMIFPALQTVVFSFKDAYSQEWVGTQNYSWIFTNPEILKVLRNTAIWVLLGPIFVVGLGLIYAVLVDGKRGEAFLKSLIFLPLAISGVAAAIIWKFVFTYRVETRPQIGLLNQIVIWLGITPPDGGWLINAPVNTLFLIVAYIWGQTGFAMVLLSAAIKNVPTEMIEAARLDGVNSWQLFWKITVPSIRPALLTVYMTVLIFALKAFDIIVTMTGGNFDTSVLAYEMYFRSFPGQQRGQGSALAVLLFVLVLPAVIYQVRNLRLNKENR